MSTLRPCNMRGPRLKTLLFLLLLLLTALTRTVLSQNEDGSEPDATTEEETGDAEEEPVPTDPDTTSTSAPPAPEDPGSTVDPLALNSTSTPEEGEDEALSPIIILIPVVLVVVIISMIVCGIFINRKWNIKARNQELRKEDPYLDGPSTEKVPMPMFEEDVPSVLELEMEELDQWMKKDGDDAEDSKQA
ncbi:transmembrane protein 154 [Tautogolabrus adspersus]